MSAKRPGTPRLPGPLGRGIAGLGDPEGQLVLLARCTHPKQAVVFAVAAGAAAYASGRAVREALMAALAMLLVQLACGLLNDVCDRVPDGRALLPGKPVAEGRVPTGNAGFTFLVLLLISVPASLQNGTVAGGALLLTYVVAFVHNRLLHRTVLSWLGWAVTFALYAGFLSYGGWGSGSHGAPPTWPITAALAGLGVCVHFLTTLPDLVGDNRAGLRSLPLLIALRTGALRLLVATVVVTVGCVVAVVLVALGAGLRQ